MENQNNSYSNENHASGNKGPNDTKANKIAGVILIIILFLIPEWIVAAFLNVMSCGFEGTGCSSPVFYIIVGIFVFIDVVYAVYKIYRILTNRS